MRFGQNFRKIESETFAHEWIQHNGQTYARLSLRNTCEFALKKDYTDNWKSEMHERFCFWTYTDWMREMEAVGFQVLPQSNAYTNDWIVKNRLEGKVRLYRLLPDKVLEPISFPVTHMLLLAEKRVL